MNDISAIRVLVSHIKGGGEVDDEIVKNLKWSVPETSEMHANYVWLAIRRFVDDADIRGNDTSYDRALRDGIATAYEELLRSLQVNRDNRI